MITSLPIVSFTQRQVALVYDKEVVSTQIIFKLSTFFIV